MTVVGNIKNNNHSFLTDVLPMYLEEEEEKGIKRLNDDAIRHVFAQLTPMELAKCGTVCHLWNRRSSENYLWSAFYREEYGGVPGRKELLKEIFCRCKQSSDWIQDDSIPVLTNIQSFSRQGSKIVFTTKDERIGQIASLYTKQAVIEKDISSRMTEISVLNEKAFLTGWNRDIEVWDLKTMTCDSVLKGHQSWVRAHQLHEGKLISASDNGQLIIWDIVEKRAETQLKLNHSPVQSLICFGQSVVVSFMCSRILKIIDLTTNKMTERTLPNRCKSVALTAFRNQLITAHEDMTVRLWDTKIGNIEEEILLDSPVTSLSVAGKSLVIGHFNGKVSVWKLPELTKQSEFKASNRSISLCVRTGDELAVLDLGGDFLLYRLGDCDSKKKPVHAIDA
jgi:WD40 repeat protein